jgi:rhodanese-related sulfurtransferase
MTWLKNLFQTAPINQFPSQEWLKQLKTDKNKIILDVRSARKFVSGHIPKAHNVDMFSRNFNSEMSQFDIDTNLYVYCRSGKRSMMAFRKLYKLGFEKLNNLQGGIMSYKGPIKK